MNSGREIEAKYSIDLDTLNWDLAILGNRIRSLPFLKIVRSLGDCTTTDYYFSTGSSVTARLRDSVGMGGDGFSKQLTEITFKSKDRGDNFNRAEENIGIDDCAVGYRALEMVFGAPTLQLHKNEEVYWTSEGLIISLAQVNDTNQVYLEIEGPAEEMVLAACKQFEQVFEMKRETRSLLEIFATSTPAPTGIIDDKDVVE